MESVCTILWAFPYSRFRSPSPNPILPKHSKDIGDTRAQGAKLGVGYGLGSVGGFQD